MKHLSMTKRFDREAGQGSVEYLGVIVVAVLLIVALAALAGGFGDQIGGFVTDAIDAIGDRLP